MRAPADAVVCLAGATLKYLLPFLLLLAVVACQTDPTSEAAVATDATMDSIAATEASDADELLEALPPTLRRNAVLLERSGCLHQADIDHPRIVLFSPGARLLVALSTDPSDPRRDVVDMAELGEEGWRFRALDLAGGPSEDCASCHGDPGRPIWGSHPNWPGAFGDEVGVLNDAQREALAAMMADESHRVSKLELDVDHETQTLFLVDRYHAPPNTVLGLELGAASAEALALRMSRSPRYRALRPALLLADECWPMEGDVAEAFSELGEELGADLELREALYAELGLDDSDLRLDTTRRERSHEGFWSSGSAPMHSLVSFLVLDDLLADDEELAALFAPIEGHRQRMLRDWWQLDGEARRALFRAGHEVVLDPAEIFESVLGDAHDPRRRAFCEHLARAID